MKMKMNKLFVLGILILTSPLSLLSQINEWKSFEGDNYSIEYPADWELNESGEIGTSFILFGPVSSEEDLFRENVNLLIQDLKGYGLNLETFVEISEGQVQTMITDGKIIESTRQTNQALPYQKMIFTGKQGTYDLKFEQYYWVVDDKAYVLTFTCEETQFDNYKTVGEKILDSFQLK